VMIAIFKALDRSHKFVIVNSAATLEKINKLLTKNKTQFLFRHKLLLMTEILLFFAVYHLKSSFFLPPKVSVSSKKFERHKFMPE
jgi:hypothetical protein